LEPRERRWWIAAGVCLAAIYLSLYPAQLALDWLRARNLLRLSLGAGALAIALAFVIWMVRRGAGWREWAVSVLVAAIYVLVALRMEILQERVHLAEYAAVALCFRGALAERRSSSSGAARREHPPVAAALGALLLAALAGYLDELIQKLLPNRRYDLRDVATNAIAAALALGAAELLAAARRRDGAKKAQR